MREGNGLALTSISLRKRGIAGPVQAYGVSSHSPVQYVPKRAHLYGVLRSFRNWRGSRIDQTHQVGHTHCVASPLDIQHHCNLDLGDQYRENAHHLQPRSHRPGCSQSYPPDSASLRKHDRAPLMIRQYSYHLMEHVGGLHHQIGGFRPAPHPCASFKTVLHKQLGLLPPCSQ